MNADMLNRGTEDTLSLSLSLSLLWGGGGGGGGKRPFRPPLDPPLIFHFTSQIEVCRDLGFPVKSAPGQFVHSQIGPSQNGLKI